MIATRPSSQMSDSPTRPEDATARKSHIAARESDSLCRPIEKLTAFLELESPARIERVRFAKRDLWSVLRQKARII